MAYWRYVNEKIPASAYSATVSPLPPKIGVTFRSMYCAKRGVGSDQVPFEHF